MDFEINKERCLALLGMDARNTCFDYACDMIFVAFVGAFAKLRKATQLRYVRLSAWNWAPTGRILMKLHI
jgi:hypothetical protein